IQSFGGGSATLYLIRRAAVTRNRWLTDEEFARYWGICQIAPGINILGLVILIGWRVAGAAGIALALGGLLLWGIVRVMRAGQWTARAWWVYKYSLLYLALLFVAMVVDRQLAL
ncbi:MAG TPA: chromate transporter, partial [Gemmatimonadaceae bacterium]